MLKVLLEDLRAFDVVNKGRGLRRLVVSTGVWGTWFNPGVNIVGKKSVEILRGLEEVIVVMRRGIWEDEGEEEGEVLVVPERDREVVCWEEEVLEGWRAAKGAGLGDGVKLRMLAWRREGAHSTLYDT